MLSRVTQGIIRSGWLWLIVILAVFVTALLLWNPEPCNEGYYWEQHFGCVRK